MAPGMAVSLSQIGTPMVATKRSFVFFIFLQSEVNFFGQCAIIIRLLHNILRQYYRALRSVNLKYTTKERNKLCIRKK